MKRFFKLKSSSKSGYSEKKNVMYNQTNVLALTALTALHADDFDNSDDSDEFFSCLKKFESVILPAT